MMRDAALMGLKDLARLSSLKLGRGLDPEPPSSIRIDSRPSSSTQAGELGREMEGRWCDHHQQSGTIKNQALKGEGLEWGSEGEHRRRGAGATCTVQGGLTSSARPEA